jgi:hypothetical protein
MWFLIHHASAEPRMIYDKDSAMTLTNFSKKVWSTASKRDKE